MSVLLEGALVKEFNEELGYFRYDYRNKETDNSRNGHPPKIMRITYGKKDVIGMYDGENEGVKNRGVQDILIACVDGLNVFPQAIEAVYLKTEIQQ